MQSPQTTPTAQSIKYQATHILNCGRSESIDEAILTVSFYWDNREIILKKYASINTKGIALRKDEYAVYKELLFKRSIIQELHKTTSRSQSLAGALQMAQGYFHNTRNTKKEF